MKKFRLYLLFILILVGCNDKKELIDTNGCDTFSEKLQSSTVDIYEKSDIEGWLSTKIDEIENENSKNIAIVKVKIYQGLWNKQTVYFITNGLSSCFFCEVYYENGEKIDFSTKNNSNDFCNKSKNWKLIYEYGNGIF